MPASAARIQTFEKTDIRLPALLLIGGCLNGFAVRVIESLGTAGLGSLTLGLSPFELIAFFVAAKLCWCGQSREIAEGGQGQGFGWLEIVTLALILVPSSAVSWAAVAFYAAAHARRGNGDEQTGALLFLALSLCALWSSVVLKAWAGPITTAEAFIVGQLVFFIRPDIVQSGNVIGNPAIHSLILMTACTTANGLPLALVGLTAIGCFLGGSDRQRLIRAAGFLAVLYTSANMVRLSIMSLSGEAYAMAHGPIGANIFDGLQSLAVVLLGSWTARS